MTIEPAPFSGRDGQIRSAFAAILETLCQASQGALGAGLVDEDGECVDVALVHERSDRGWVVSLPAYRIKLTGAHLQIVMRQVSEGRIGHVRQLWVQADTSYVAVHVHAGYVLVLVCHSQAIAMVSQRAIRQCEVELCVEAGWPVPQPDETAWIRTAVQLDERGTPVKALLWGPGAGRSQRPGAGGSQRPGAGGSQRPGGGVPQRPGAGVPQREWTRLRMQSQGSSGFERRFDVRSDTGIELELVREPSGLWFVGGPLDQLFVVPQALEQVFEISR